MKTNPYEQFASPTLAVIPLFILMGAFAERSGMATAICSRPRASSSGIARAASPCRSCSACTIFGAICGSSVATTATFGRAALPELRRYRYDDGFSTATIAIGGVVDLLIPPSIILVVYAITTEQNIIKLFKAALIPGLLARSVLLHHDRHPRAPNPEIAPTSPEERSRRDLAGTDACHPAVLVIAIVDRRHLWRGVCPHDGLRLDALRCSRSGSCRGGLAGADARQPAADRRNHGDDLHDPARRGGVRRVPGAARNCPTQAAEFVSGPASAHLVMAVFMLFYLLLGAVMDELAMLLLTLPVFFPVVKALDFGHAA